MDMIKESGVEEYAEEYRDPANRLTPGIQAEVTEFLARAVESGLLIDDDNNYRPVSGRSYEETEHWREVEEDRSGSIF